jgi:hypothetical protein
MLGSINVPTEIVSILGGCLVTAAAWQLRISIILVRDLAVLKARFDELLSMCPVCKNKR